MRKTNGTSRHRPQISAAPNHWRHSGKATPGMPTSNPSGENRRGKWPTSKSAWANKCMCGPRPTKSSSMEAYTQPSWKSSDAGRHISGRKRETAHACRLSATDGSVCQRTSQHRFRSECQATGQFAGCRISAQKAPGKVKNIGTTFDWSTLKPASTPKWPQSNHKS